MIGNELLDELTVRVGWAVLHSLWQGALLGLVVLVLLGAIRNAAARHVVGLVALLGLAALMVGNLARPLPASVTVSSFADEAVEAAGGAPSPVSVSTIEEQTGTPPPSFPEPEAPLSEAGMKPARVDSEPVRSVGPERAASVSPWWERCLPWVARGWFVGVLVLLVRQVAGWSVVRRWRREGVSPVGPDLAGAGRSIRARLHIARDVPVLLSERVVSPLLVGVVKPAVLLPIALVNGLKQGEVEALLAHELAHLRRQDGLANLVQIGVETLLFYHPVIWWLGRRIRQEREHAADDLALKVGGERSTYVRALAAVASWQQESVPVGPVMAASGGSLVTRVRRLVTPSGGTGTRPALAGVAGSLVLVALVVAVAIGQSTRSLAEEPDEGNAAAGPRVELAEGQSIQAAIEAAKPGTTIVLPAGTFDERIAIEKAITIEGAGWDKTILHPQKAPGRKHVPTVMIKDTEGVMIRGLSAKVFERPKQDGRVSSDPIVFVSGAKATIAASAIVGPTGNGINVRDQSELVITGSLVAAAWGTGVAVEGARGAYEASRIHVKDCVVRNCYHRGITLGPGCNDSVIERSWIAGSAWHGIRYDHASPRIERNIIFDHARSGIYASGKTAATVKRNAFINNAMGGMSCWFDNADTIEGNIFIDADERELLAVLGGSKPKVTGNWFLDAEQAIICAKISGRRAAVGPGKPTLERNMFSNVTTPLKVELEAAELPAGNLLTDELEATKWPIPLHELGPVEDKKAAVGYIMPGGIQMLCHNKAWPKLLPEEERIVPAGDSRDYREWNTSGKPRGKPAGERTELTPQERQKRTAEMREAVKPWIDDAFQLEDTTKRDAAIEKVRAALQSGDEAARRRGLLAFTMLGQIRFDKASFHGLILSLLGAEDPWTRSTAAGALVMAGVQDGDIDRLIAMIADPDQDVRQSAGTSLVWAAEKKLTGKVGEAVVKLLHEEDQQFRKQIMNVMWGGTYSPGVEARVIELSRNYGGTSSEGYDALYYALSTQANKSEAGVKRLIEFLADRDTHNVGGRAAWGLGQGVAKEEQGLVAEAALKVVAARSESYLFREALKRLQQYAGPAQAEGIRELLAKPGVDGDFRKALEGVLATVDP